MISAHHHTAICVSHWETSVAFYKRFGFEVVNDWFWPDGVRNHKSLLRLGDRRDCWLEFFEFPNGKGQLSSDYRECRGCVYEFVLAVPAAEDVDRLCAAAPEAVCEAPHDVSLPGEKGLWSFRRACVAGPDGERMVFLYDRANAPAAIGFHHNALRAADLARSIPFYSGLGFSCRDLYTEPGSGVRLARLELPNGNGLLLREEGRAGLPSDAARMQVAGSMFQYCFRLDAAEKIDAVYELALSLGARERIKPFWHEAYGLCAWKDHPAFVYGPDDEILEFLYIDYN